LTVTLCEAGWRAFLEIERERPRRQSAGAIRSHRRDRLGAAEGYRHRKAQSQTSEF
jgi:hypothetical protein